MKLFSAVLFLATVSACVSIDTATLPSSDVAAQGEAIAVVQATSIGLTALFNIVPIVESDLDQVTRELIVEAKGMGASKIQITHAVTTPRRGIFRVLMSLPTATPNVVFLPNVVNFPMTTATAIILK